MRTDEFAKHTAALRDLGGSRVWSLMISIFGDLAQDRGQSIPGPVLSAIMAGLHVKPEAARVALHRLRNDGWIISQKSGRISEHSLSDKGRAESAAASPRIYASPDHAKTGWQFVMTSGDEVDISGEGFIRLQPRIYVGPATAKVPDDALCFTGSDVPPWLRTEAAPRETQQGFAALGDQLKALQIALGSDPSISPLQVAVIRTLIVHNWRRLVLKHPTLPAPLVDPEDPAAQCQLRVTEMLKQYPRPRLKDINQQRMAA
ncbi:MAG: PaaX family transcriptional regulator C-terminal domain-containing protein [Sulfitobacter sp.]